MLRNRAFLIGLGSGIILGALLLQLMMMGEQSQQKLQNIGNESEEKLFTQADVDALLAAQKDSVQMNEQIESDASKSDEQAPSTPVPSADQETAVKDDQTEAVKEETPVEVKKVQHVIHITAGTGLSKTATLLADDNIISDQAKFIAQMKNSKKLVRAGYFLFNEGISVAEAITVVTSKPLTKAEADAIAANTKTN